MRRSRATNPTLVIVLAATVVACGGDAGIGPPEVRLGRDECVECGMLIMEDRCSAARLIEVRGTREAQHFDDIGCMLEIEREDPAPTVVERYVRDHGTRAWVPAARAAFIQSEAIHTPMASGIVAFADRSGAEARVREAGGAGPLGYAAIGELRVQRQRERRERSGGG